MDVSVRQTGRDTTMSPSGMRIVGLMIALGCLVFAPPLHAEGMNHGGDRGGHAHMAHPSGRHDGYERGGYYGGQDYFYGAPPVIYAPAPSPGITLFMPLRLR